MNGKSLQALPVDVEPILVQHWRSILFGVVMLLLVFRAAWRIRVGINPESFWLDDQWVTALVMHASLPQLLELMPPAPLGFVVLLQAITAVLGWGHWQLQLLPIIFGLTQIPLIGWIAWRATGRMSLGLIAAILLSGSVTFLVYTLRLKQYTLEGLIVLILIVLTLACKQRVRGAPFLLVVLAAVAALPFSFTAIPVGLVIVNVLAMYLILASRHSEKGATTGIVVRAMTFNVIAFGWLWLVQLRQANETMFSFWTMYYAPVTDLAAMMEFSQIHLKQFLTGALPSMLGWMIWLVPAGIVLMLARKWLRFRRSRRVAEDPSPGRSRLAVISVALGFALFYCGMLALSAMETYPLGGRRTDIFSYPITILAIVAGIWACSQYLRVLPMLILGIVVIRLLLFFPHAVVHYPVNGDRNTVETVASLAGDEDGIILGPKSSWAMACYGSQPVDLIRSKYTSNGFIAQPACHRTVALAKQPRLLDDSVSDEELFRPLEPLLAQQPKRIWLVSIHRRAPWVKEHLELHGYQRRDVHGQSANLTLFQRDRALSVVDASD